MPTTLSHPSHASRPAPQPGPSRRRFLGTATGTAAGTAVAGLVAAPGPASAAELAAPRGRPGRRPPNVVFVSIDDLGWDELGAYGNTFNETPHLDRLAREGVRFTSAYAAAPLCSPTRAALVTGRYPARSGITDFLRGEAAASDKHLSPDIPTVPDVLRPHGYTTGLIGKWHLTETYSGPYRERPGNPFAHGFDEVIASEEKYIADGDYFHPYFFLPDLPAREPNEYLTDRLAAEAVDFLTRHRDEPFFLHLSNYAVHTVLDAKPELVAKYRAKPGADESPNRPVLAAMLESVDQQVGRIAEALAELGLDRDTLLLVTSDNGGPYRDANQPLRGGKGELYEGGIRVPLIAHWPGRVRGGRSEDTPVSTIDVLPTALDLAGGRPGRHRFDGVSLAPVLTGAGRLRRDELFWVYPHFIGSTHPHAAVRSGRYKLVRYFRDGRAELYDLARDPGETTDLSARHPGRARALRARLEAHLAEVDVLPPTPSRAAYPVPELAETFDGDLARWSVLPVTSHVGDARVENGRLAVSADQLTHLVFRSDVTPGSDAAAAVLTPGTFAEAGTQDTVFVGVAQDADNYLLFRYHNGLHRVGWDLRIDGQLVTAGAEPLQNLDGTVDLTGPGARYAFVLRGTKATAYADQGDGWEFLFTADTGGALDLSDPAVRARYRWATSVRLDDGTITLDGLTAHRA
ncbi:sulfatase-like hydrolase/transferase [Streptomyces sp. 3MP-14]|uniref:Sulfatase-like hydrolase/transferase n=1 Tax=Streptomyces mimosae TaxID=2586635 RepID=A0A5N6AQN1_9ACTN|nr:MULTISPECIES: sulfatase [Streptomyces]KAB8169948.1 sulfatase-like hydrolase/transferase [Streptomyces mimosae]KAB8178696.1 sulfatase-like hydrolase/transferase [Streptomyces sp. 3MP-14]